MERHFLYKPLGSNARAKGTNYETAFLPFRNVPVVGGCKGPSGPPHTRAWESTLRGVLNSYATRASCVDHPPSRCDADTHATAARGTVPGRCTPRMRAYAFRFPHKDLTKDRTWTYPRIWPGSGR